MAAQPTPSKNSPNRDQANPLHPPPASNPGTANSGSNSTSTTPAPPQFNLAECSKYLSSRNTAAMEALSSQEVPANGTANLTASKKKKH
ncbi:hypothetical protein PtA15_3A823 [Puccinia triticina]|uniref:Uncharacterized protein n=1 Tax=Puccinia triticina TaxID=208348 RepID=A0ABY7CG37_9BASI|nr:uncharacterized protein PtA15_3A823 [Puccinia triticina]WAQ83452.1 hypothetical protein PtA15_3A823 [Puccinia triticina]WAR54290.1 hypothetical protein PtB15_3B804 [Puccinia triticina]